MSPLTRPGSNQSLVNQPTVMDEYADAIEAIRELPEGVRTTDDFGVLAGSQIASNDAITGWGVTGTVNLAPTLDTTTKMEGTGSVKFRPWSDQSTTKVYYNHGTAVPRGAYSFVSFWIRHAHIVGWAKVPPWENIKIRVADATDLTGNYVEVPFPRVVRNNWYRVFVDVTSLTNVRSVGVAAYAVYGTVGAGQPYDVWFDDIRFRESTEAEEALLASATAGVLIPPSYVPGITEPQAVPRTAKSVMDLRPNRQYVTGLGGVRHIREFGPIAEDGSEDVTLKLTRAIDSLAEGETLQLTARAEYLVNEQVLVAGKRNVTIDAQDATLFTTANIELRQLYLEDNIGLTIRNLRQFGNQQEYTANGNTLVTVAGTPTNGDGDAGVGTAKLLTTANQEVRGAHPGGEPAFHYARDKGGNWRFDFMLSESGTPVANNAEVRISTITGRLIYSQQLTLTGTATWRSVTYRPAAQRDYRERLYVSVKKITGTNTVTVHRFKDFGRVEYSVAGDASSGIWVRSGSDYVFEGCHVEGMRGDGLTAGPDLSGTGPSGVLVRDCTFRACSRHAISSHYSTDLTVEDSRLYQVGYSAIDLEPGGAAERVVRPVLRNLDVDGCRNIAIAFPAWYKVEDLVAENILIRSCAIGAWSGGSVKGRVSGLTVLSWDSQSSQTGGVWIIGYKMLISDVRGMKQFALGDGAASGQYVDDLGATQTANEGNCVVYGVALSDVSVAGDVNIGGTNNHVFGLVSSLAPTTVQAFGRVKATGGIDTRVVATGSLPAAGVSMDGHVLIEDVAGGDRNLIIYAGGQRFRIDGGAAF